MSLSMYQASVPVFLKTLGNLSAILDKGAAFADAKKVDPAVLLGYRLAPDMLPLTFQVQTAADTAKRVVAQLAGVESPVYEDNETTFPQLKARIDKTVTFLKGFQPAQVDGTEGKKIELKIGGAAVTVTGQTLLLQRALPNFFFHVTTAYDLLRHAGVEVGKRDYLGQVERA